jgi:Spy/CpxP family protein refolding chaperone
MKWIAIFMMLISLSAFADNDHHFPMDLHDLGLTKQQHHTVEDAMKEYQYSNRRYHRQNEKSQEELNALFLSPSFDSETYRAKSLEIEKASIEIRARLLERLHPVLSAEQKRRFVTHMEDWDSE